MNTGTEDKKKIYILIALLVVAAYFVYTNVLAGPGATAETGPRPADAAVPAPAAVPASAPAARTAPMRNRSGEFHPVYLAKRLEDRPDPRKIDPTLQLDLFAKVQEVGVSGGSRNLFQFADEPPKAKEIVKLAGVEPVVPLHKFYGPKAPVAVPPPGAVVPPPPPPITVKFYGFSLSAGNGRRMGYFMDGDEILLAGEGDTLERKYRVVRISPGSALLEDLSAKRQQSVPLTAEGPV